jgi:protein TonB
MPKHLRSSRYRGLKSLCWGVLASVGMASAALAAEQASTPHSDPVPKVRISPNYPPGPFVRRIQGWVDIEFGIDEEGNVINPVVLETCSWRPPVTQKTCKPDSGEMFAEAALAAVSKWKYEPELENGVAVQRQGMRIILRFRLAY